jgi:sugar O-acyltransferase (sialic acid O-acetyltransferase NeuD family)
LNPCNKPMAHLNLLFLVDYSCSSVGVEADVENDRQRVVVIGAGGHAKVVLEALWAMDAFEVVGLLDPSTASLEVLGAPILGGDELLPELYAQGVMSAVVAIGSNDRRQRIGQELIAMGFALPVVVHPTAFISPSATIAQGAVVMARAVVGTMAIIGELAIINTGAIVEHDNRIGQFVHVCPGVVLAGGVRIGDRALLGVGSSVRPDISIGNDSIIGAGSVVVANVPPGTTVAGSPARKLSER